MRKQFLWVKSPGLYYAAPGNVEFSQGDTGSLSLWYHAGGEVPRSNNIWRLEIDDSNSADLGWTSHSAGNLRFTVKSNGVSKYVERANLQEMFTNRKWWLVTITWDFTTPGAGVLHLYLNATAEDAPIANADAPLGVPYRFYIGGKSGTANLGACIDNLVICSGVMSREQHNARLGSGDSFLALRNARRAVPQPADFAGDILFHAGFDAAYDAYIASGDATARWEVSAPSYDQFALLDDGSRYRGRKLLLPLGRPRQDFSSDDRIPGDAVLDEFVAHGIGDSTVVVNDIDCSRIVISQAPSSVYGEGRGWLWEWLEPGNLEPPCTLRMRVNMPDASNPKKYWTALGPLLYYNGGMHGGLFANWGTGAQCTVLADGGNTASSFKTSLTTATENYWVGAELAVITGNCSPARLKVSAYNAATKVVTLGGALPAVPDAASLCVVDFRGRLCPFGDTILEKQSMEAWLWEEYGSDRPWVELECQHDDVTTNRVVRYNRGRTAYMEFTRQRPASDARAGMMFGKHGAFGSSIGYSADIRIESIELDGPANYQRLPATTDRYGRACAPCDNFMVKDPKTALSTRIWRCGGVDWRLQRPTKYPDPAGAVADLQAAGTWRQTCTLQEVVQPQTDPDAVVIVVRGTDPQGTERLGYLQGSFDGTRMTWTDETPPSGKSNPFMNLADLHPDARSDSGWGVEVRARLVRVFGLDDGTWAMTYNGAALNPDHYFSRVLHGAADRWSFSHALHYWPQNPICPGMGGVDKLPPEYGGVCLWGNRDAEWEFIYNQYAAEPAERFLGYARGKTIAAVSDIGTNLRPLIGVSSPDLKAFHPLPHGNTVSPLPGGAVHAIRGFTNGPDNVCLLVEYYGSHLRLWSGEDNLHFQQTARDFILGAELPGEPVDIAPQCTFRIGDWRIYYYSGTGFLNYASIKFNRETYYDLSTGSLTGFIETSIIEKPQDGWGNLYLNADPQQGTLRVEVINPADEQVVAGYGAAACDALGDAVRQEATWGGARLSDLTQPALRLRFSFSRTSTGQSSPRLFAWEVAAETGPALPAASNPQVEGRINPAGITNPDPQFTWDYSDPRGKPQGAYHILVASSQELLDANDGDLWDSTPCSGSEQQATYAGAPLAELSTYFWKVRVCNSEGAWSEEW